MQSARRTSIDFQPCQILRARDGLVSVDTEALRRNSSENPSTYSFDKHRAFVMNKESYSCNVGDTEHSTRNFRFAGDTAMMSHSARMNQGKAEDHVGIGSESGDHP